ncbi:hypothetical protein [Pseudonocardia sp. WMMC193]|uniref:hypothetical protein n=1 Tax=Pseudonocardia sp. WMMC193 TaxID=2911965 RepID=UPI001F402C2D|nr:hypothetical protein [Pseudonocardia sp. WMMC193]MCF7547335.1 hypothetical protein [Pseudonocardia sp. WMMC193]
MSDRGRSDGPSESAGAAAEGLLDQVLTQAGIDAVRAALRPAETPEQIAESTEAVRAVIGWVEAEHGLDAVRDLLLLAYFDQAELLSMLAQLDQRDAETLLDDLTHDIPRPRGL